MRSLIGFYGFPRLSAASSLRFSEARRFSSITIFGDGEAAGLSAGLVEVQVQRLRRMR